MMLDIMSWLTFKWINSNLWNKMFSFVTSLERSLEPNETVITLGNNIKKDNSKSLDQSQTISVSNEWLYQILRGNINPIVYLGQLKRIFFNFFLISEKISSFNKRKRFLKKFVEVLSQTPQGLWFFSNATGTSSTSIRITGGNIIR